MPQVRGRSVGWVTRRPWPVAGVPWSRRQCIAACRLHAAGASCSEATLHTAKGSARYRPASGLQWDSLPAPEHPSASTPLVLCRGQRQRHAVCPHLLGCPQQKSRHRHEHHTQGCRGEQLSVLGSASCRGNPLDTAAGTRPLPPTPATLLMPSGRLSASHSGHAPAAALKARAPHASRQGCWPCHGWCGRLVGPPPPCLLTGATIALQAPSASCMACPACRAGRGHEGIPQHASHRHLLPP